MNTSSDVNTLSAVLSAISCLQVLQQRTPAQSGRQTASEATAMELEIRAEFNVTDDAAAGVVAAVADRLATAAEPGPAYLAGSMSLQSNGSGQ